MYKIAILGNPIKHSLSPKIHNYWLKEMKINAKYTAIKTPIKNLEKTNKNLSNKGYKEVNLTIPLKEEVLKYINSKNKIVDIKGELVEVIESSFKISGQHSITWNPKNIASGVYFMNISTSSKLDTQKLMFLK